VGVIERLLERRANPEHRDIDGMTAVMFAARSGAVPAVDALVNGKADREGGEGRGPREPPPRG